MMIESMSLEQKIGQLLMVGFQGTDLNEQIVSMIRDYHVGSVITFPRNIRTRKQVKRFLADLRREAEIAGHSVPLMIATDQENGRNTAKALAAEMRDIGYNMVLSPSLDINSNPLNPIIGVRSFGGTPEIVAKMGGAFIHGSHEGGIGSAAKHFPGHGDTDTDSHRALPVVNHPLDKLLQFELVPFMEAIKQDVDMMMISHIYFSAIEQAVPYA